MAEASTGCTVVIATRNRCQYLVQALQSALLQEQVSLEVVVVDDASSDTTAEYLGQVSDGRVRVIHHAQAVGVSEARNSGINAARRPWIAFLDDDDLWAPTKLAEQLAAVRRTGASWSYTGVAYFTDGVRTARIARRVAPLQGVLQSNPTPTPSSVIVSRAVLRAVGGFDPELTLMADWDLWIRVTQFGAPAIVAQPLVGYRHHLDQMSASGRQARETVGHERRYMMVKHRELLRHERFPLGGRDFWLWRAGVCRSAGLRIRAAAIYLMIGVRYRSPRDLLRAVGPLVGERIMHFGQRTDAEALPELNWIAGPGLREHRTDPEC